MIGLRLLVTGWIGASTGWCDAAGGAVDLHVDLPFAVHDRHRPADLARPGSQITADTLRRGCVRVLVLSLFVPPGRDDDPEALLAVLATAEGIASRNGWARLGASAPATLRVVYAVEGAGMLADRLDLVPALVERGVLLFGPVHRRHNALAESATDPHPHPAGLSPRGRAFAHAVYRAGGILDVAHASDRAFAEIAGIAASYDKPLVASHANARAICDHPRNLGDDQLRIIAASGGVVGLAFHAPFLDRDWRRADAHDFVAHAEHLRRVMGPGHVAVGTDLDGLITPGAGLHSHAALPVLGALLRDAGWPADEIAGLLGGNAAAMLRGLATPRRP